MTGHDISPHAPSRRGLGRRGVLAGLPLLVAACTVGPDHRDPLATAELPPAFSRPGGGAAVRADWWRGYGDPVLDGLVDAALRANPDLARAGTALRSARELVGVAAGSYGPRLDGGAALDRTRLVGNPTGVGGRTIGSAGLDASWEIDLFGGRRRRIEEAEAGAGAAGENLKDVHLALVGALVQGYVGLRGYQAQIATAREAVADRRRALGLVRDRLTVGAGNGVDVAQAEVDLAQAEAAIPPLEEARQVAMHQLAVLTGRAPGELNGALSEVRPIPTAPLPSSGVPADLARRRPDIRRAERELARAVARVGVNTADLYPRLSIGGSLTVSGGSVASALAGPLGYGLGPSLTIPLLDAGVRQAVLRGSEADAEGAVQAYRSAVLAGLKDVEDALVSADREAAHLASLRNVVTRADGLVRIARGRYSAGAGDFLSVLDAQRSLYGARDAVVRSQAKLSSDVARLYKALGGGW